MFVRGNVVRAAPWFRPVPSRSVTLIAALVALTVLSPVAPEPAEAAPVVPQATPVDSVPVTEVPAVPDPPGPTQPDASDKVEPAFPPAATGQATVPAPGSAPAPVGTLPVYVSSPPAAAGARAQAAAAAPQVQVGLYDQTTTEEAEVHGLLLRVDRTDAGSAAADVDLTFDYSTFETAYGASWADRLRVVSLPECALTTPEAEDCEPTTLKSTNDVSGNRVKATVSLPSTAGLRASAAGGGSILAVAAGSSGSSGSYAATSLSSSATWSAGGSTGDFSWSYPMRTPPGLNGPQPEMNLAYSAQSVDGRHAAANTQPSVVGEGFEFSPNDFIERRYVQCGQDMDTSGHNNTKKTGDLCWETDNATMSLAGGGGELIYNATDKYWHLRRDDGTKVEKIVGGANYGNDDDNGEHWRVTTADGTKYYFGKNRLDGWTAGKTETNSVYTAPVFGNDANEPCHDELFKNSDCKQAWRWNLDYVVDPHGNTMSLWYERETNRYARNNKLTGSVEYVRGGNLQYVSYGTDNRTVVGGERTDSVYRGLAAPMRVEYGMLDRCLRTCTKHTEKNWPDTPWDQECKKSKCLIGGPSFWNTKRLATVTTRVRAGSDYRNVERWTLTHTFPDPGDGTRAGLWLSKISHQGLAGATTPVPDVEFTGVQLDNRVDTIDHSPAMKWWRIAKIRNESGGTVSVNYSDPECVAKTKVPTVPENNTLRCYPVRWTPEGYENPVTDYFHKYVVSKIYETDHTGGVQPNGSPRIAYTYDYIGAPAWRYTDDDGMVKKKDKTWSQWRGYAKVGVTVGDAGEESYSESTYFRGMDGDHLPSGTRSVTVPGTGVAAARDSDAFAGMEREKVSYNRKNGPETSRVVKEPWQSEATASRTLNGNLVEARFANTAAAHERTVLDGGRATRVVTTRTTYDDMGMPVKSEQSGAADPQCSVTTYARNQTAWIMALPSSVATYAKLCKDVTNPATLTEADVIGVDRTLYDGGTFGEAPSKGEATENQELTGWTAGTPSFTMVAKAGYDDYGRVDESWDAMNKRSTTAYDPPANAPVTKTVLTNPLLHTFTSELDPAWGLATATEDANGKRTANTYDGLGRSLTVRKPGGTKDSVVFSYNVRNTAPSVVTTSLLTPSGSYAVKKELYDGLQRLRQIQAPSSSGGRLLSDVFYDSAGLESKKFNNYYNNGAVSDTLVTATDRTDVPNQTRTAYDGNGRVTAQIFQPYDTERTREKFVYGGDRVDHISPTGGAVTSKVTDASGRLVELREYYGATPTGSYDKTVYQYNNKGQMTKVIDAAGNERISEFDIRGREKRTVDLDKGETLYSYDNAGRVISTTDQRQKKLIYTYDNLGRKTAVYDDVISGSGRARWTYDGVAKGQLTQSTRYVNGAGYSVKIDSYTDDYKPKSTTVSIPSTELGLNGTYTYLNSYNVDGSVAATALPATGDLPGETITNHYDPITGQPKRMTTVYGTSEFSYVADTDYNALGQVDQVELYTGLYSERGARAFQSFEYELETGLLKGARVDRELISPYTVANWRYDYNGAGEITKIADVAAPGGADNQCFKDDYAGRMVEAWTPTSGDCSQPITNAALGGPAKYWLTWEYDKAGRRLSQVDHAAANGAGRTTTYQYPSSNAFNVAATHMLQSTRTKVGTGAEVQADYTYDATGNTKTRPTASAGTQTMTWDTEGRLETSTDSTGATSYLYDADGNRLISRDPKGKTLYLTGQELRFTTSTAARTCTRYYAYLGQTVGSRTASGLTWIFGDSQGTANVAMDEKTQEAKVRRQTPFGEARGAAVTWPNSKGFVGGTADGTGLTHLGAREYDPGLGRFVSVDPVFSADDPSQLNPYSYAGNNPVERSDASGLSAGGSWTYVGSRSASWTSNGYRYYYTERYYMFCKYGGSVCLASIGGRATWMPRYVAAPSTRWLARVVVYQWREKIQFIGPVALPKKQFTVTQQPQLPSCPKPIPAPEPVDEFDGLPHGCDFWEVNCLWQGRAGEWWRGNRDWVTGVPAVVGFGACVVATAGVCAAVGGAGLGIALTGRVLDAASSRDGFNGDSVTKMGIGMTFDVGSYFLIPGVRSFKMLNGAKVTQPRGWMPPKVSKYQTTPLREQFTHADGSLNGAAVMDGARSGAAQVAWCAASCPDGFLQYDIPITDPFKWTVVDPNVER